MAGGSVICQIMRRGLSPPAADRAHRRGGGPRLATRPRGRRTTARRCTTARRPRTTARRRPRTTTTSTTSSTTTTITTSSTTTAESCPPPRPTAPTGAVRAGSGTGPRPGGALGSCAATVRGSVDGRGLPSTIHGVGGGRPRPFLCARRNRPTVLRSGPGPVAGNSLRVPAGSRAGRRHPCRSRSARFPTPARRDHHDHRA